MKVKQTNCLAARHSAAPGLEFNHDEWVEVSDDIAEHLLKAGFIADTEPIRKKKLKGGD